MAQIPAGGSNERSAPGSLLSPVPLNVFINDLADGAVFPQQTCGCYSTKLGGVADMPEGCAAVQGDLERLEK